MSDHYIEKQMRIKRFRSFLWFLLLIFIISPSCRDEHVEEKNQENEDFYAFMNEWYYWYEEIPEIDPSLYQTPGDVLEAIRYRPLDRWSYISGWEDFIAYYQESKFIGYGFGSSWDSDGKLRVSFIFNSVDLYELGVRRGWIIDAINGTTLSKSMNVNQLLGPNNPGVENTLRFIKPDNTTVELTAAKEEVIMNTVLHNEVIQLDQKKVAYLVLQGFTEPSIRELDDVFSFFAAEQVDDIILDLRYNGGGLTFVANYIASMIGGEKVRDQVFVNYEYNDKKSDEYNRTTNFIDSVDIRLDVDRLIAICSRQTASASELVINSLDPYMPVFIIGNNTYGKPMGMNVFSYPSESPVYAFVPITFKTRNANLEGDYFDGLPADIFAMDDLSRGFGDPEEASLKEALKLIEWGVVAKGTTWPYEVAQPRDGMTGLRHVIGAH